MPQSMLHKLSTEIRKQRGLDEQDKRDMPIPEAPSYSSSSSPAQPPHPTVTLESLMADFNLELKPGATIWQGAMPVGHLRYLFGRSVKATCCRPGHGNCFVFMQLAGRDYGEVHRAILKWLSRPSSSREDHMSYGRGLNSSLS